MHPAELFQLRQPIHASHQNVAQSLFSAFKVHFTALRVLFTDMWIESGFSNPTQTESLFEKTGLFSPSTYWTGLGKHFVFDLQQNSSYITTV